MKFHLVMHNDTELLSTLECPDETEWWILTL